MEFKAFKSIIENTQRVLFLLIALSFMIFNFATLYQDPNESYQHPISHRGMDFIINTVGLPMFFFALVMIALVILAVIRLSSPDFLKSIPFELFSLIMSIFILGTYIASFFTYRYFYLLDSAAGSNGLPQTDPLNPNTVLYAPKLPGVNTNSHIYFYLGPGLFIVFALVIGIIVTFILMKRKIKEEGEFQKKIEAAHERIRLRREAEAAATGIPVDADGAVKTE